jgi:hypothetical protein
LIHANGNCRFLDLIVEPLSDGHFVVAFAERPAPAATLRAGGDSPDMRATLEARFIALVRAHGVLMERNWKGADLRERVDRALDAFVGNATTASGSKDRPLTSRRR